MATPASNSVGEGGGGAVSSNPFSGDHTTAATCLDDPNFATICSFIQNFGEIVRIGHVPFDDLQKWLENTVDVPLPLVQLHLTLLRRIFKSVSVDKWERSLAKFGHMNCSQDAWEIERFGYKKAKIQTKLNILKNLCEAQFDFNAKFKAEVNKLQAADLRLTPLGRDTEGQLYWYQVDEDANLRVYREDIDDETWEIVASTKDELVELISQLQRGEVRKPEPEAIILPEEDSNSKDGISPKEIILDTGKVEEEEEESSEQDSQQSGGDSDEKTPAEVKKVEPLLLRNVFSMNKLQANQVTIVDNSSVEKCKEDGKNGESSSETKPGIKMVFGMKSKSTLETLFPPPPASVSEDQPILPKAGSDQTDLSRLEETVAKLSERHFAIVPKSDPPPQERTMKSEPPKDKQVVREVDVQNMNENAMDTMISEKVLPKSKRVQRDDKTTKEIPAPPSKDDAKTVIPKTKEQEAAVKTKTDLKEIASPAIKDKAPEEKKSAKESEKSPEKTDAKSAVEPEKKPSSLTAPTPQKATDLVKKNFGKVQDEAVNLETVKPEPMEVEETAPEIKTENISVAVPEPEVKKKVAPVAVSITPETKTMQEKPTLEIPPPPAKEEIISKSTHVSSESQQPVPSGTEQDIMPLPSEVPKVPEAETESIKPSAAEPEPIPVTEKVVGKKISEANAKVCEKKEEEKEKLAPVIETLPPAPVIEPVVAKSKAFVCGEKTSAPVVQKSTPAPAVEPLIKKSEAFVCGDKQKSDPAVEVKEPTPPRPPPVVQPPVKKSETYICGEKEKPAPAPVVEEPKVTKEDAWVCGSKAGDNTTTSSKEEKKTDAKTKDITNPTAPAPPPCEPKPVTETVKSDEAEVSDKEKEKVVAKAAAEKTPVPVEVELSKSKGDSGSGPTESNKSQTSTASKQPEPSPAAKPLSGLVFYADSSESSNDGCDDRASSKVAISTPQDSETGEQESNSTKQVQEKSVEKSKGSNGSSTASHPKATAGDLKEDKKATVETESELKCTPDLTHSGTVEAVQEVSQKGSESVAEPIKMMDSSESTTEATIQNPSDPSSPEKVARTATPPTPITKEKIPSTDDTIPTPAMQETKTVEVTGKRKAEEDIESSAKVPRLEEENGIKQVKQVEASEVPPTAASFNPIVGETIEEEVMTIIGEGSGAPNEGSNENSPVPLAAADVPGSQEESEESDDESQDSIPSARGRGGRRGRGRGRRGRPPAGTPKSERPKKEPSSAGSRGGGRGRGGLREVARLGVSLDSIEVNGENDRPMRASRRIAQIRQKEEEERRQLEEERLAQLKAAQMQKKAKQQAEKKQGVSPAIKTPGKKGPGRKSFKEGQHKPVPDYIPEDASESEDNSEEEEEGHSDDYSGKLGKKKKLQRKKNGKALGKKPVEPRTRTWDTSSEGEDEEAVEEEEEYHYEEEEEELVFKSDHEFSPESDLGEDEDAPKSRHARTAKQDKGDLFEEGNCCKCRKGDHPEWILLCDKCDKGWHASCLRPQLWVIPEGEWFCPPCQHNMLVEKLNSNLVEYEVLLKKRENEILRKQRLAYVGISLDNVLPDKEEGEDEPPMKEEKSSSRHRDDRHYERRKQRRRILLSDEDDELSDADDFIDNRSNGGSSRSRSSGEDSDEPTYRLRARRTKKAFNFKEYDDMINSALRVDDDEEIGEEIVEEGGGKREIGAEDEDPDAEPSEKQNGDDDSEPHAGGGKNDAYLKHLEKQAQEEETDEELLDEKERLRRKELKKGGGSRKAKRRINDLDAYSEEEDSDDDFKASEAEDEDEELGEEGESEWSGDKMEEDSDDSIAKRAKRKERHGKLGRREKYSDKGLVRRSTRKRRARISYDESDEDEEEEDQNDKWQSDEETEEEMSESNSDSDDDTWGKRKKKALAVPKSSFFSGESSSSNKGKGKGGVKRKKRKTDEDDVDRAWSNSGRGKKEKEEVVERRTRGRKINFKDILDSGESDDEGNIRPKRRPLSDSDDSRSPSSSRKLAEEIRAENARKEKEYEERKAKMAISSASSSSEAPAPKSEEAEEETAGKKKKKSKSASGPPPDTKVAESGSNDSASLNSVGIPPKVPPPVVGPPLSSPSPVASPVMPSPGSLPPSSSPMHMMSTMPIPSPSIPPPPLTSTVGRIPSRSPIPILPPTVTSPSSLPLSSSSTPPPIPNIFSQSVPPPHPILASKSSPGLPFPITASALGFQLGAHMAGRGAVGQPLMPILPPVPVSPSPIPEKKSKSKGSRKSKSEKHSPHPVPAPMELELALTSSGRPGKGPSPSPSPPALVTSKSSSKKQRGKESPINVPNPALLMSGGGVSLPDMLAQGMGIPPGMRSGGGGAPVPNSGSSRERKSSSGNHHHSKRESSRGPNPSQQTTPPPVSQNLSPSMPVDIDRVPNPALFQGNPGMRPFHPMWVRNPGPPPGYGGPGGPIPTSLGKPPPLNTSPFGGQQGPPPRPGFASPPPLRIPSPNTSSLQAFQHFKRDGGGHLASQLYRLPPGQPQSLANILPPGMSPHSAGPERFFGGPSPYGHPYGFLPPHAQGQHPQSLFPYDYRPPEAPPHPPFKEDPLPPRTSSSSLPIPVSSASSSPPPPPHTSSSSSSAAVPSMPASAKEDGPSEFGGLVSYFSSQRSEEDMDT